MRALVVAALLCVATTAHAAPWSFDLPAGYTEHPDSAQWGLARQHEQPPNVVSIDGQTYQSPDDRVRLSRLTLLYKADTAPTRDLLESMDQGFVRRAEKRDAKQISLTRQFHGDQLVAEQVDEVAGLRVEQRRIYAADSSGAVHLFALTCAGPAGQLAECETAQQSMVLMLPNQAPLDMTIVTPKQKPDLAFLSGQIVGGVLVLALVIWYVVRRRRAR